MEWSKGSIDCVFNGLKHTVNYIGTYKSMVIRIMSYPRDEGTKFK